MTQKEERLKHRRPLSTTEKILKIRELKAQGKTQVQIAKELNICRRTVCNYWHTTDKISKQEAKRKVEAKEMREFISNLALFNKKYREEHKRKYSATEKIAKVKELRAKGLLRAEIAEVLGIAVCTVSRCINTKRTISKQESKRKNATHVQSC